MKVNAVDPKKLGIVKTCFKYIQLISVQLPKNTIASNWLGQTICWTSSGKATKTQPFVFAEATVAALGSPPRASTSSGAADRAHCGATCKHPRASDVLLIYGCLSEKNIHIPLSFYVFFTDWICVSEHTFSPSSFDPNSHCCAYISRRSLRLRRKKIQPNLGADVEMAEMKAWICLRHLKSPTYPWL